MPQTWGSPSAGSEFSASTSTSPSLSTNNNKPKRSKSLAARFRAGRKNPTNPLSDGDSPGPPGGGGGEDGRHAGTAYESDGARSVPVSPTEDRRGRNEWPLGASVPASMGSNSTAPSNSYPYPSGAVTSPPASSNGHGYGSGPVEQLEIRTQAIKFDESLSSPTLERTSAGMMSRSLTEDGLASPTSASGGGKKGHGLKRLFSTKRKVRWVSVSLRLGMVALYARFDRALTPMLLACRPDRRRKGSARTLDGAAVAGDRRSPTYGRARSRLAKMEGGGFCWTELCAYQGGNS